MRCYTCNERSGFGEFFQNFHPDILMLELQNNTSTFAAGLAVSNFRPIVAIYSTFLQRAYDQLIHDIALQNLNVTFAVDRAGFVGADGAHTMALMICPLQMYSKYCHYDPSTLKSHGKC